MDRETISSFGIATSLTPVVTVEFDPVRYNISESDRYANITVVKRGSTTQTISVNFTIADGIATGECFRADCNHYQLIYLIFSCTAGQDYTTTSQTVTFAPSEESHTVNVPIIDDSIGEGLGQFIAQLSVPTGQSGVVLGEDMATVEITDDDRRSSCH